MNKITKITAIAFLTLTAGTCLAACSSNGTKTSDHKLFSKPEPKYDKSLTLDKIYTAVAGDAKTNETTDLKGKVFKGKVDHIGKSDVGIKGIVLEGTPKDDQGDNKLSIVPNDQGNIKAKKGDTVYLKITNQTDVFGLVLVNVDEVAK
ncbi:hypothetical protein LHT10_10115 [Lactococcus lactis]|uniref:hypothetical protein n=1 Tax=Lactococcus lactis TaxID=1358 RepID=UPI001F210F5C|nr:hypothetical protein [Lactococcus lactis]MCG1001490.1 hypothetical protein [Lactococcus lactis]